MARGDWTELDGTWTNATAIAALGDAVYIADGGGIYRIAADGSYAAISDDEWRPTLLAGAAGALLAFEPDGSLYRVDPTGAGYERLAGDWSRARLVAAGGDALFVIEQSGTLYRVSATDGSYAELGEGYDQAELLATAAGSLVAIEQSGVLFRVSPRDGVFTQVADDWGGSRAAAGDAAAAYIVAGGTMYTVDPQTGQSSELNDGVWATRLMAAAGGWLYVIEDNGALFRIEL